MSLETNVYKPTSKKLIHDVTIKLPPWAKWIARDGGLYADWWIYEMEPVWLNKLSCWDSEQPSKQKKLFGLPKHSIMNHIEGSTSKLYIGEDDE